MVFSKSFPKTTDKSAYPKWVEIVLSEQEEKEIEELAHKENIRLMKTCLDDAKQIMAEKNQKPYQTDLVRIAIALFEKQASHSIYWKENKAKEKFDAI